LREAACAIDVEVARRQHAAYVAAIKGAGWRVVALPALDEAPDSVFVEDPVVVLDRHALLANVGAASRRVEGASIEQHLVGFEIVAMEAPATLDGGDVLRVGRAVFVGLSQRTNRAGFEVLAAVARAEGLEPVAVPLGAGLHLKSACSPLADGVIGCFDRVDRAPFAERGVQTVDALEPWGANVLELGSRVLVSSAAPATARLIGERAFVVDVSELHKGDGALTCLSIRLPSKARAAGSSHPAH
jgi:dimethylargininase